MKEKQAQREREREGWRREEGICAAGNPPRPVFLISFFLTIIRYKNFELTFRWDSDYFGVQKCPCFTHAL